MQAHRISFLVAMQICEEISQLQCLQAQNCPDPLLTRRRNQGSMMPELKIAGKCWRLPENRPMRVTLGGSLVIGGVFGFLPILGFWMVPVGLLVLSHDFHKVRRWRRRTSLWWARRKRARMQAA